MTIKRWIASFVTTALITVGLVTLAPEPTPLGTWNPDKTYEIAATQDIKYVNTLPYRDGYSEPKSQEEVVAVVKDRMKDHRGEGFKMRLYPEEWSKVLTLATLIDRLPSRLDRIAVGDVWVIRALIDDYVVKVSKVDLNPAVILDTAGTRAIDIIIGTAVVRNPSLTSLGLCVCKRISGTSIWSQHAYCNAIDFGATHSVLDDTAAYLRSLDAKGYIPLEHLLWQVPDHYYHVHADGDPNYSGTPACAS